jgi:hypothetical protein
MLAVEASSKHRLVPVLLTEIKKSISVALASIDREAVFKGINPVVNFGSLLNLSICLVNLHCCPHTNKGRENKSVKKYFISVAFCFRNNNSNATNNVI